MTIDDRDPDSSVTDAAAADEAGAAFDRWLRSELVPVTTAPARAAAVRLRAHAELRRATDPPTARAGRQLVRLLETSTALAAGASFVLWTLDQLWRR